MDSLLQLVKKGVDSSNGLVIQNILNYKGVVFVIRKICQWQKKNQRLPSLIREEVYYRKVRQRDTFSKPCGQCCRCLLLTSKQEIYCGKPS